MRQISLCITNYNRKELLLESFAKIYDNEAISEIIISDDCSDMELYIELESILKSMPKVKMFRNESNVDCYRNKKNAIELASNQWVIILDSDNIIDFDYLYRIFQIMDWDRRTIYAPDFAMPTFCYEQFSGTEITRGNVSMFMDEPMFETCLNTFNFFVHRDTYLRVWDGSVDPVTSDSIFFCMKWLEAGYKINIVSGLRYFHRVHEGNDKSHYNGNIHRTPPGLHQSIINRLRSMV